MEFDASKTTRPFNMHIFSFKFFAVAFYVEQDLTVSLSVVIYFKSLHEKMKHKMVDPRWRICLT